MTPIAPTTLAVGKTSGIPSLPPNAHCSNSRNAARPDPNRKRPDTARPEQELQLALDLPALITGEDISSLRSFVIETALYVELLESALDDRWSHFWHRREVAERILTRILLQIPYTRRRAA
jgi:hypothetical protein